MSKSISEVLENIEKRGCRNSVGAINMFLFPETETDGLFVKIFQKQAGIGGRPVKGLLQKQVQMDLYHDLLTFIIVDKIMLGKLKMEKWHDLKRYASSVCKKFAQTYRKKALLDTNRNLPIFISETTVIDPKFEKSAIHDDIVDAECQSKAGVLRESECLHRIESLLTGNRCRAIADLALSGYKSSEIFEELKEVDFDDGQPPFANLRSLVSKKNKCYKKWRDRIMEEKDLSLCNCDTFVLNEIEKKIRKSMEEKSVEE